MSPRSRSPGGHSPKIVGKLPKRGLRARMAGIALCGMFACLAAIPYDCVAAPLRLTTTKSGTVSGDVYVDAYQNPAWSNQSVTVGPKEFTQAFAIPAFTSLQWARMEVVVYAAGTDARHGQTTMKLDGNGDGTYEATLGVEDQKTAATANNEVYTVNDHMDRNYSDYRIWYEVTALISAQAPSVYVKTENLDSSTFDGRVKEISLIVAYDDGDADQVMYWVNTGHDYQATSATGVTTTFDTTTVPSGFTSAILENIGLSSKDALYTFNTLAPIGANPVAPYGTFNNNAWDVTSGVTAGTASSFTYKPNGGSYKTTFAILSVKSKPDLAVAAIKPNSGAGDCLFANESNTISVTVQNKGAASSQATTLAVDVDGTPYTAAVSALSAGASEAVSVTDTVLRLAGTTVKITATAGSASLSSTQTVYNNGYKGKRWTGGADIATQVTFEGHIDVLLSAGNSAYNGAGWSEKTYAWSTSDLPIPSGATVSGARLYQGYTWDQTPGGAPLWTMTFNGSVATAIAVHTDRKGYGTYDYPQGLFVYDVTSLFSSTGNTMTITPQTGNSNGIYGAYLVVVYCDPASSYKKIWINDGCDALYAGTSRSVSSDEATAYAPFSGANSGDIANAKAIAILASAGDSGKSKFFFNNTEYAGFWKDYQSGPQVGFSVFDVTLALAGSSSEARLQSYISGGNGDNMYALNVILSAESKVYTVSLAASPEAAGTTSPSESASVYATNSLEIAAAPAKGYSFDSWTADNGAIANSRSATTTITPSGDCLVTANFVANARGAFSLTVNNGSGGGSYAPGTEVEIEADAPEAGMFFDKWDGFVSTISDPLSSKTKLSTLAENATITAQYKKATPVSVSTSVIPDASGSIEISSSTVFAGQTARLTATAAAGYVFVRWESASGVSYASQYSSTTYATVEGDAAVSALFAVKSPFKKSYVRLDSSKASRDEASVTESLVPSPTPFEFDPDSDTVSILVDGCETKLDGILGTFKKVNGKNVYKFVPAAKATPSVRLLIDLDKALWTMTATKVDKMSQAVTNSDGVGFFIIVSKSADPSGTFRAYGDRVQMVETTNWKKASTVSSATVSGMVVLSVQGGCQSDKSKGNKDHIKASGAFPASGVTFSPSSDVIGMTVDGRWSLLANEFDANLFEKKKIAKWKGVNGFDGSSSELSVDFSKGQWSLGVSKGDLSGVDGADGLGFSLDAGSYEGSASYQPTVYSVMKYTAAK